MDNLTHPVVSRLILFLRYLTAFAYYVMDHFMSITSLPIIIIIIIISSSSSSSSSSIIIFIKSGLHFHLSFNFICFLSQSVQVVVCMYLTNLSGSQGQFLSGVRAGLISEILFSNSSCVKTKETSLTKYFPIADGEQINSCISLEN